MRLLTLINSRLRKVAIFHSQTPKLLNEAVNFELRCIFIAVPKAGTTTVRKQIRQVGVPLIRSPHLSILQVRDVLYAHLLRLDLGKNRSFPSDRVPADRDIRQNARAVFESFFKFAAVRNPWARAVSLYFRRDGLQVRNNMSFEEFCERHMFASDTCIFPTLQKNQFDWLCDENGQCVMDFVYKVEDFEEAVKSIASLTNGRIVLRHQTSNKNPESKADTYRQMYNSHTKRLIATRFEKDIDFFKYSY
jgi:hypothetical protein